MDEFCESINEGAVVYGQVRIRTAEVEDAAAISELVRTCTRRHIAASQTDQGLAQLLASMNTEAMADRLREGYQFFVAAEVIEDEQADGGTTVEQLIGTVAIRLPSHLYYLFVETQHQQRGIGRALWNHARDWLNSTHLHGPITVNASQNAIVIYQRLGFVITSPPEVTDAVWYQPMRYENDSGERD